MNSNIYGVILAAGESTRMGSSKALLKIGDKTFLEFVVGRIKSAGVSKIIAVLGHNAEKIISQTNCPDVKFIINENYQKGQLSSIQAGINSLPEDAEAAIIFPVDRPLVTSELVNKLIQKYLETKAPVVVPIFGAKRGHPIIFSSNVFKEILRAPEDVGARAVVWAHHNEVAEVQTSEEGILINIDTLEMYSKYVNGH
ncbi:MAG: nucleotidyltransferase family protein [Bacteroidota bacterium]|nr:nucleotidyltransferase family protein [Bacteroidota bacterium]